MVYFDSKFSYTELRTMPVYKRTYFYDRFAKEKEKEKAEMDKINKKIKK